VIVRPERSQDEPAVRALVQAAFGRELEADLVERLRADPDLLLSLVAEQDGAVCGQIMFSRLGSDAGLALAQLSPLAVAPALQRTGIGAALVEAGLAACHSLGLDGVVVLGHPDYYPRFGFSAEAARAMVSPFAGQASFMALALRPGVALDGEVRLAAAFDAL
jgi:putative acetyltransferase